MAGVDGSLSRIRALVLQALGAPGMPRLSPAPARIDAIVRWVDLVERWNERVDLTAARSREELIDLLLIDAVYLTHHARGDRLIDVGTGAGAPGLGVALFRPELPVTLVEPLAKRVAFLRTVIGTVRALNVEVVRGKGEDVVNRGATFPLAVARATLPPAEWLDLGAQLAPEGSVFVLLARDAPPTKEGWSIREDITYTWPLTGAQRRMVRYQRGLSPIPA
jgi:16S rRNA (guanine527-N7)-methyltransferase